MRSACGRQSGFGKSRCRCLDIEADGAHALAKIVALRRCPRRARLKQDRSPTSVTDKPTHAVRQRKPGSADTGAEVDGVLSGQSRHRRRQQDGIVTEPMAA